MTSPPSVPSMTDLLIILVRLETKMDGLVTQALDHETRLRTLEKARWPLPSVGVLTGVAGVIGSAIALMR